MTPGLVSRVPPRGPVPSRHLRSRGAPRLFGMRAVEDVLGHHFTRRAASGLAPDPERVCAAEAGEPWRGGDDRERDCGVAGWAGDGAHGQLHTASATTVPAAVSPNTPNRR